MTEIQTMADLDKVFGNKDLLYFLAGLGGAMSGKQNPFGLAAGALTQESIKSSNYMELMKHLLGQGGKLTMDKEKSSLAFPTSALSEPAQGQGQGFATGGGIPMVEPNQTQGPAAPAPTSGLVNQGIGGLLAALNPSGGSLDLSGLSLAGLTPDDISKALQLKTMQQEVLRKSLDDIRQGEYWQAAAKEKQILNQILLNKSLGTDTRTTDIKEFEYAKNSGSFGGTLVDWQMMKLHGAPPTSYKEWELARKQGYAGQYPEYLKESAQWSKPTIEEEAKRKAEVQKVMNYSDLKDPSFINKLGEEVEKDTAVKMKTGRPEYAKTRAIALAKKIQSAIIASGAKILEPPTAGEGNTIRFRVRTPTGTEEIIEYGL